MKFKMALILWISMAACQGADLKSLRNPDAGPVTYTGPEVRLIGRVQKADASGQAIMSWAGSAVTTRFTGTSLTVGLENLKPYHHNDFEVIIDDKPQPMLVLQPKQVNYTFDNLPEGTHTATVVKRTEASYGEARFLGFQLDGRGHMLPTQTPSGRRIEFIGDSITNGYGVDYKPANGKSGKTDLCNKAGTDENATAAYSVLAARELKADYALIAWAGHGVMRNADGSMDNVMPQVWNRATLGDPSSNWDFSNGVPQVVVINLGTNDLSPYAAVAHGLIEPKAFGNAYRGFLEQVRSKYADAHIVCTMGPMLSDFSPAPIKEFKALSIQRDQIKQAVESFNAAGDKKVHFLEFPVQSTGDAIGCEWHPNAETQQKMAAQLTSAIKQYMQWQ